jgi:hydrogenase nickel incorporation protein HypB
MDSIRLIEVKEGILSENDGLAQALRDRLRAHHTFLLNLMSSPGSGKTSLILRTIENLKDELRLGVLEADIDSLVDAEKVSKAGVAAVQLRTGGFCHLDAAMTSSGLDAMNLDELDLIVIENVGNLVCPAEFDTGAIKSAMILSIPEGDDKPLKYPLMFSICDALLINKMDLMPLSDFNLQLFKERVRSLNPHIQIFEVSCKTGQGIEAWVHWLRKEVKSNLL